MSSIDELLLDIDHSKIIYEFELSSGFNLCMSKKKVRYIHVTEGPKSVDMTDNALQTKLLQKIEKKWDEYIYANQTLYDTIMYMPISMTKQLIVAFLIFIIVGIGLGVFWYTYLYNHTKLIRPSLYIVFGIVLIDCIFTIILITRFKQVHTQYKEAWLKNMKYEFKHYVDTALNVEFSNINPNYLLTLHEKKYKLYIVFSDDIVDPPKVSFSAHSSLDQISLPMDSASPLLTGFQSTPQ